MAKRFVNLENRVEIYYKYLKKKDLIWLKTEVKSLSILLEVHERINVRDLSFIVDLKN